MQHHLQRHRACAAGTGWTPRAAAAAAAAAAAVARVQQQQHQTLRAAASRQPRGTPALAVGGKDSSISTADWRAQEMTRTVRLFFDRVWSRGEVELIHDILTDDFVWKDAIWSANRPIVGAAAFKAFVEQMRQAYPDLSYTIDQMGVSDTQHMFIHWQCDGTNLSPTLDAAGNSHKPSFHTSHISGVDFITFNADRSRLAEVLIYRQPTLEEREFLEEEALAQDRLAIRLERLHFSS